MIRNLLNAFKGFSCISATRKTYAEADEGMPRVGLGLPGGSVQGPVLVGVLQALAERNIDYDVVVAKSIGADVAAIYEGLRLKYEMHPDMHNKYPGGPVQELTELIINHSPLFRFYTVGELPNQRGFIDITRLIELVKKTTEERELSYFPRLKIVAHVAGTTDDVIFGDVAKDYPAWKAAAASSCLSGVLNGWDYDGSTISGVLNKGQVINDGGTLRVSPLRELYALPLDLRICAFLGIDAHADEIIAERSKPISMGMVDRIRIDRRLVNKLSHDYEWARIAFGDRDRFDFKSDIHRLTGGKSLEQAMAGAHDGLLVIAPSYEHVKFSTNYPTERLITAGNNGSLIAIDEYFKSRNIKTIKNIKTLQG